MPNWPATKFAGAVIGVDQQVAARNLQQLGVSLLGAQQFLKGEAVLLRNDRLVLSRIVLHGLRDEAGPQDAMTHIGLFWRSLRMDSDRIRLGERSPDPDIDSRRSKTSDYHWRLCCLRQLQADRRASIVSASVTPYCGPRDLVRHHAQPTCWRRDVELDAVPDKARTPKASAVNARTHLAQLGFTV